MKTALLLTNSAETQRLLTDILGDKTNIVLLPPPPDPSREQFDALFSTWLRLVDAVILDAVSLGETTRWAVESLAASHLQEHQAVVVRATVAQQSMYRIRVPLAGRFRFGFRRPLETGAGHILRVAGRSVQAETSRCGDCPAPTDGCADGNGRLAAAINTGPAAARTSRQPIL